AGFIGSPTMNFVEGAAAQAVGAHTMGIRPEHMDASLDGKPSDMAFEGTIAFSEVLGSDTFAHVDTENAGRMIARLPGNLMPKAGDRIWLVPRQADIHRFDANGKPMGRLTAAA
ncbi:MAG: TOBE domain-containing protein, partial [Pseudomonadota bacterium]